MSAPLALLPTCTLWIDGVHFADGGTPGEVDTDPVALTDLSVTWGRDNALDQPEPGTCTFRVLDVGGGRRFNDVMHIGSRVQVRADATIYPDPTVPVFAFDPGFEGMAVGSVPPCTPAGGTFTVAGAPARSGTRSGQLDPLPGSDAMSVIIPPAAYGGPSAWDTVPRTLAGQTWRYGLSVVAANLLLANQLIRVRPVAFTRPAADSAVPLYDATLTVPVGTAVWQDLLADFVPPEGVWLGLMVDVRPAGGVQWDQVPYDVTWDSLGVGAVHTNLATNPTPASVTGWLSNDPAQWTFTYAAGEISVQALPGFGYNLSAAWYGVGGFINDTLTAGVNYQRSIEIWVDANSTVIDTGGGGFTAGQLLPANTWTRVVQQFVGTGAVGSVYALAGGVLVTGTASVGVHVKLRRAQLIANPGGQTLPYFDGTTPDTADTRYDWTGAANASTSTATDIRAVVRWDDIGRVFVDDLRLLAPAAGALRSGTVFTGRITDLRARYDLDLGGTVVDVIAQTHLAELGNRYVGAEPWVKEALSSRFGRIVSLSGQPVTYQIDSTAATKQISWRDVDNRPSGDLLHQLAQSVGGALWSAATANGDAFVWLEDINNRPAMHRLVMDPDGVIRIHLAADVVEGAKSIVVDACDVLLEPVEWVQTTEDDATRVVVSWRDQTKDNDGNDAPTQRDVMADDPAQEAATGRRRVQVGTELAVQADAEFLADSLLARLNTPGWRIGGLVWDLTLDPVDADTLERVMKILDGVTRLGLGILLTNVPDWAPPATGDDVWLFLEGGRFINQDGAWRLELLTSAGVSQGASLSWDEVPADWSWDEFDASITWNDLYGVGV